MGLCEESGYALEIAVQCISLRTLTLMAISRISPRVGLLLGLPRVPGYPSGTRVINYPGNFLLPDGYPGSEYLICRVYLIGLSELVQ